MMTPEQTLPPIAWEKMSEATKKLKLAEGTTYGFMNYFVYDKSDSLLPYDVKIDNALNSTTYYMIDFRNTIKVGSKSIETGRLPIKSKILQLSIAGRTELREKLSYFYRRPPKEDQLSTIKYS